MSKRSEIQKLGKKVVQRILRDNRNNRENMRKVLHKNPTLGTSRDFFEITPEMVAYLDIHLGRDIIRVTKEAQHIFKLDNNQGYMLLMTWANDRFRKYGNPTVNNLLPITHLP